MPTPIRFEIERHGSLWRLSREGVGEGEYSHLDRATHDAVARARELQDTGTPAGVYVHVEAKIIEIDVEPEPEHPDLAQGAKAFLRSTTL